MFRIILADDEPIIIRGLKKMIAWEKLDSEIVGCAKNGEELLVQIEKMKPDIVISDIAMPGKSGLDVMREMKERKLDTKVILLSGFQEFSYAREALKNGAIDYLLKPVSVEELERAVQLAKQMLLQERPNAIWQKERNEVEQNFQELDKDNEYRQSYKNFLQTGINCKGKCFAGVCFTLNRETVERIKDSTRFELVRFAIFKRIQEYLQINKTGFVIRRDDNCSNVILMVSKKDPMQELSFTIEEIRKDIIERYGVHLVTGIGEITEDSNQLKFVYKTARFSAELYYFNQQETIWYCKVSNRNYTCSFEAYEEMFSELIQAVIHGGDEWKKRLSSCLNMIENLHYGNSYAAESRCILLAMNLYQELMEYKMIDASKREEFEISVEELRNQNTYEELKRKFTDFMECFLNENVFYQERQEADVIYQVKEYIQKHYMEDISLEQMAKIVYMNPYYFSTFFKKETGQNFKTFVLELRMKKAMQYLMETDIKIYELAKLVGYHDVRTFSDKFKEIYGENPSKYKRKIKK